MSLFESKGRNQWLDVFFPPRCAGCKKFGSWACEDCLTRIEIIRTPICYKCRRLSDQFKICPSCRRHSALTGLIMYGYWQTPLKELVYGFKYYRIRPLADILGNCLTVTATKFFQHPGGAGPVLIPVPLHRGRLWDRGFNQAQLLADYVGHQLAWPVASVLVRRKFTQPQFGLSKSSRQDNLEGAFCLRADQKTALIGRTVLLVDDIVTTGATLNECAKILKQNGAKEVWGLVLAKA